MAEGRSPSLEEIAEAAMVSRATAYRYFPGLDALLVEAALDVAAPSADILRADSAPAGLADRLAFVGDAFDSMIREHEAPLRTMMVHALQRRLRGEDELPVRQNRRMPVIEAAIGDAAETLPPAAAGRLAQAMALVIGTESMLVFKDVLQLGDEEAREVRRWATRALAGAALAGD
ncbi:MAG: TetR family transcriptional regulator [Sphingomonas sp.]|nr:TetR family transcriptional regulator [Sphingomonas sp.]